MPSVSATLITYNEEAKIARAIRSLSCVDEVIVVDAESTDATREIAAGLGARVVVHPFEGFAAQKNLASRQARHEWILSLDADEELDEQAQAAVARWKASQPSASGFRFARRAYYLGRWILHSGWYPDYKLRLFDRRCGAWRGSYVHESVLVNGKVETLPGEILHYTCDTLNEHRGRIEFYTDLAAREMVARGARMGPVRRLLTPPWVFLETYLLRRGILDGRQGFCIAWMAAHYVRRKYAKARQLLASG